MFSVTPTRTRKICSPRSAAKVSCRLLRPFLLPNPVQHRSTSNHQKNNKASTVRQGGNTSGAGLHRRTGRREVAARLPMHRLESATSRATGTRARFRHQLPRAVRRPPTRTRGSKRSTPAGGRACPSDALAALTGRPARDRASSCGGSPCGGRPYVRAREIDADTSATKLLASSVIDLTWPSGPHSVLHAHAGFSSVVNAGFDAPKVIDRCVARTGGRRNAGAMGWDTRHHPAHVCHRCRIVDSGVGTSRGVRAQTNPTSGPENQRLYPAASLISRPEAFAHFTIDLRDQIRMPKVALGRGKAGSSRRSWSTLCRLTPSISAI